MKYTIENKSLRVSVKEDGAELSSVFSKKNETEFLWQGDPAVWYGQSPILFPIVGRLYDDEYRTGGKTYSMPKHGLFRKRKAALKNQSENSLTFVQISGNDTLDKYPFDFEVEVVFSISGNKLSVDHMIRNIGHTDMPYSFGAHPAFNCAIGDVLEFSANEYLSTQRINEKSLRIPEEYPVINGNNIILITEDIFNEDALILKGVRSKHVTLHRFDGRDIIFELNNPPYLGIWAKPGAPYVCIEPWWGVNDRDEYTDDILNKECINVLAPGEAGTHSWSAEFI